jgi:hypothetical protein
MNSKGKTSRPIAVKEEFSVENTPALQMFSTQEPSIVKDIETLTSPVTHVSTGLLQSNKALFRET